MSRPTYLCVRCGVLVHNPGVACRDCRLSDPVVVRSWTKKGTA